MHVSLIMLTEISNQQRPINLPSFVRSRIGENTKCFCFVFAPVAVVVVVVIPAWSMRREWEEQKKKNEQQQLKTITKTNQRQNKTWKSFLRVSQIVHRLNCTLNRHRMQRAWRRAWTSEQANRAYVIGSWCSSTRGRSYVCVGVCCIFVPMCV